MALGALGLGALALFAKVKAGKAIGGAVRKYLAKNSPAEAVEMAAKPGAKSHEVLQKAAEQKKNVIQQVKSAPKNAPLKLVAPAEGAAAQAVQTAAGSAARGGFFDKVLKGVKRLPFLNFLLGGAEVAATELDDSLTRSQKNAAHTETAGAFAGSLAGAKVGAVAGSFAGPVGTIVGSLLGMLAGGFAGSELGEAVGNWAFGNKEKESADPPASKQDIEETVMQAAQLIQSAPLAANLNLTVELDGEVIARKVEQAQLRQATRR